MLQISSRIVIIRLTKVSAGHLSHCQGKDTNLTVAQDLNQVENREHKCFCDT